MSGKGGVGKTTVAVNLSVALSKKYKVGLLDVDIHGPNVPKMLGLGGKTLQYANGRIMPVSYNKNLDVVSMAFLLEREDTPIVWRGPLKHKAIAQFLNDVEWEKRDFLVVDLPPGTGDEAISIAQLVKKPAEAIIVSTPQEVALLDVKKCIGFARSLNVKVLGLIENMSGDIFGSGNVKKVADNMHIPFLGSIPMDRKIAISGDTGKPIAEGGKGEFSKIVERVITLGGQENTD